MRASGLLDAETQNEVSRKDISETKFFENAFSLTVKQNEVQLWLIPDDGTNTFDSVHCGAMAFAEGCYTGTRIPCQAPRTARVRGPRTARRLRHPGLVGRHGRCRERLTRDVPLRNAWRAVAYVKAVFRSG